MTEYITVVGNLADEPKARALPGGEAIAEFRLAATSQRRQADGTWVDAHTSWYTVTAYRRLAEHTLASLTKGQRVIVTGRFKLRKWEANGKNGIAAEIDADALGPDLLFGTALFRRDDRNKVSARTDADESHNERAPIDEQGWAAPAGEDDRGLDDSLPNDASPAPELVGASGWDTRPLGDGTPF